MVQPNSWQGHGADRRGDMGQIVYVLSIELPCPEPQPKPLPKPKRKP